jgi:hypothetical protein
MPDYTQVKSGQKGQTVVKSGLCMICSLQALSNRSNIE